MRIIDSVPHSKDLPKSPEELRETFTAAYRQHGGCKKVLYIHTPYCNGRCRYCICPSVPCRSSGDVDTYVKEILPAQFAQFRDLLDETRFDEVYFGGGTPTLLSAEMLEEVFSMIPRFREIPVKSIEASPATITFEQLDLIERYGFSFLSLGVQSLDPDIMRKERRVYISPEELVCLSDTIRGRNMYFNLDLICYLRAGDITDLPDFEKDLDFVMRECRPSSITVHQCLQSRFTCEKTEFLFRMLRKLLEKYPDYECINALLLDEDIAKDTMHRAEYRLVRERREFRHFMWSKYPSFPLPGADILAFGWLDQKVSIKANAGTLLYEPAFNRLGHVDYNPLLPDEDLKTRKIKELPL